VSARSVTSRVMSGVEPQNYGDAGTTQSRLGASATQTPDALLRGRANHPELPPRSPRIWGSDSGGLHAQDVVSQRDVYCRTMSRSRRPASVYEGWGAEATSSELWYVANTLISPLGVLDHGARNRKLARRCPQFWVNFAEVVQTEWPGLPPLARRSPTTASRSNIWAIRQLLVAWRISRLWPSSCFLQHNVAVNHLRHGTPHGAAMLCRRLPNAKGGCWRTPAESAPPWPSA